MHLLKFYSVQTKKGFLIHVGCQVRAILGYVPQIEVWEGIENQNRRVNLNPGSMKTGLNSELTGSWPIPKNQIEFISGIQTEENL